MSEGMTEEQLKKLRAEVEYPHLELLEPHHVEGLLDEIDRLRAELEAVKQERDKAHEVVDSWGDCGYCNLPTCWQYETTATCMGHTLAEWARYKGWLGCPEAADAIERGDHRKDDA